MRVWWRKYVHKSVQDSEEEDEIEDESLMVGLSRWERDFHLAKFERLHLLDEYLEMGNRQKNIIYCDTEVIYCCYFP